MCDPQTSHSAMPLVTFDAGVLEDLAFLSTVPDEGACIVSRFLVSMVFCSGG